MWDSLVERVQEFFFNMLVSAINSLLGTTANIFEKSIDNVQSGIVETPEQFSPTLVEASNMTFPSNEKLRLSKNSLKVLNSMFFCNLFMAN